MKKVMGLVMVLVLAACLPPPARPADPIPFVEDRPAWKAQIYLAGRIKGIGLVDSYVQDNQDISYVYDDALAAMAFILMHQFGLAEKLLNTLCNKVQKSPEGVLFESYNFHDANGSGQGPVFAGNTAWFLQALNLFQERTGSRRFSSFQKKLADHLVSQQDTDGGIFVLPGDPGKSTEHNLMAFAALRKYGLLNRRAAYVLSARKVKAFLENIAWSPSESRFRTSVPDPQPSELLSVVTDVNALGVLALGKNYISALNWNETHLLTTKPGPNGLPVTGFDFNDDLDTVWFEGTLQMALSDKKAGLTAQADSHWQEALKGQSTDGSMLLATNAGTASIFWTLMPWNAAAPTAWVVFYARGFNPFL